MIIWGLDSSLAREPGRLDRRAALVVFRCALPLAFLACESKPLPGPPPLPVVAPTAEAGAASISAAAPEPIATPSARAEASKRAPTPSKATPSTSTPAPSSRSAPKPRATPPVQGPSPSPAPPPKPESRVVVPSTPHVHAEIPRGLQADLDADPRMQSWLDETVATIDRCHASWRGATGTIDATLTMRESARPDIVLGKLPPTLGPVVACATGPLLRTRMPLFTGAEGTRYAVRLHFE